jgi:hypothetical protein
MDVLQDGRVATEFEAEVGVGQVKGGCRVELLLALVEQLGLSA